MISKELLYQIDYAIKEAWMQDVQKDYASDYMLKEDSLKCCLYYHLRRKLADILEEYNLRIYPEFYFSDLGYRADLAIVQIDPNSDTEYLRDAVTSVVAIIELKYTSSTSEGTASWVKNDIAKIQNYIRLGRQACQFYFAVIYEVECSELTWMERCDIEGWASGYVTELNAGYIDEEIKFEVNSYNKLNNGLF